MKEEIPEAVREYMRGLVKKSYAARIKKRGKKGERDRLTAISRAYWSKQPTKKNGGRPDVL